MEAKNVDLTETINQIKAVAEGSLLTCYATIFDSVKQISLTLRNHVRK